MLETIWKVFLGYVIMPITIPVGLIYFKYRLDRRDKNIFKRKLEGLNNIQTREETDVRGFKKDKWLYIFSDATIVAFPFFVISGYKIYFDGEINSALLCALSALLICIVYTLYRTCMTQCDFLIYVNQTKEYGPAIKHITKMLYVVTTFLWVQALSILIVSST